MKHHRHTQHPYMADRASQNQQPGPWAIWAGAACLMAGVYLVTVVLFTL